jgi:hypothetical protein
MHYKILLPSACDKAFLRHFSRTSPSKGLNEKQIAAGANARARIQLVCSSSDTQHSGRRDKLEAPAAEASSSKFSV